MEFDDHEVLQLSCFFGVSINDKSNAFFTTPFDIVRCALDRMVFKKSTALQALMLCSINKTLRYAATCFFPGSCLTSIFFHKNIVSDSNM